MERIIVNTGSAVSEILIGAKWESVRELLPESGVAIITDTNVHRIYGSEFPDFPVFQVRAGEASKKMEVVESLAERLIEAGIDRSGFLLGIGGGVVCDIAGFLASIYMRGIRCAYVSTSLLSQVDASTGGKNGVNLGSTKNILGCFRQPEFVICDPVMLKTLPEDEYFSGLAELVKTALIGNEKLFELIENNQERIIKRDSELLSMCISMAVNFKAAVVSADEKESGLRRILNFGHTYGHAIEAYKSFRHGYAIASGMELAASFSMSKGLITSQEYARIISLLKSFRLLRRHDIPDDQISQLLMRDKKKSGSDLYFVYLDGIGKAISDKIQVVEAVDFYRQNKPGN
ncbi:MAG TPA: 3-dehydroquinate synthase [Bacteroidales bacterium]|nr:3-dehydroquinate synthase [Bacteroidales bacterium]HBZ21233.1 3-dehydroquinate synthase [Bacteroidales bacterium]